LSYIKQIYKPCGKIEFFTAITIRLFLEFFREEIEKLVKENNLKE